ncbi:TraB/GumN family protein [Pseudomonas putida]
MDRSQRLAFCALIAGLGYGADLIDNGGALASIVRPGTVQAQASADSWRQDKGILFRIVPAHSTPENARQTYSLLFGTLHFGSPKELGLVPSRLQRKVRQMRTFVAEVDSNEPWRQALQRYRLLDGIALSELIGRERFANLCKLLPSVSRDQLEHFRPWVVLALLEARGESPTGISLDDSLQDWARHARLQVMALETLEQQFAALDCVPPREQAVVLRQRLDQTEDFAAQMARVLGYYRARDLPAWFDEVNAPTGLDNEGIALERRARQCLLESRNARWLGQLAVRLRSGGVFVAVGALHLTGPQGLLEGLRQQGFSVYPETL